MFALCVLEDAISQHYSAMPHDAGDEIQLPVHKQRFYIPDCPTENDYTYLCDRLGSSKNRTKAMRISSLSPVCKS